MTNLTERFVIGRIGKPRGLKGELRVFPLTDEIERFQNLKSCYLEDQQENILAELQIAKCRIVHDQVSIIFKNYDTRDLAEKLKNQFISVARSEAIVLSEDEYFVADLIGCEVYDQNKGYLGIVSQIQKNSANDVVIVCKSGEKDLLYPNLRNIVQQVDLAQGRIDVLLPPGLYEIYR
ncbi:MAG TPA: 16S rRNA processing protein RimM [Clostridiaceae bacterium]|nr:16S rRNA processing protein RimM [Clostridiaceae bacterium]